MGTYQFNLHIKCRKQNRNDSDGKRTMDASCLFKSGKAKAVSNAGATSAPKGKSRRNMRSNSSNARETRAQDWNWADVLLTHPEKKPKKQKAS